MDRVSGFEPGGWRFESSSMHLLSSYNYNLVLEKISILSHTHQSFSNAIQAALGKGHHHATMVYEEFFRTGKITGDSPAFNNAKTLLHSILDLTDITTLQPFQEKHLSLIHI